MSARALPCTLRCTCSGAGGGCAEAASPKTLPQLLDLRSPTLTLTCRRWRAVFYSEPAIWRCFTFHSRRLHELPAPQQQQALAARMALLQRVAPMVAAAEVVALMGLPMHAAEAAHARLEDFVQALPGPSLTRLTLCCPHEGVAAQHAAVQAALAHLTALHQLEIECGQLPSAAPWALARLLHLRTLVLRATAVSSALVASVAQHLTALTELQLHVVSRLAGLPDSLTTLTLLALLQRLVSSRGRERRGLLVAGWLSCRPACPAAPVNLLIPLRLLWSCFPCPQDLSEDCEAEGEQLLLPAPAAFPALHSYDWQLLDRAIQASTQQQPNAHRLPLPPPADHALSASPASPPCS